MNKANDKDESGSPAKIALALHNSATASACPSQQDVDQLDMAKEILALQKQNAELMAELKAMVSAAKIALALCRNR